METMTARGKRPLLGIAVEVEEAFIHSDLWEAARHDAPRPIASLARIARDHSKIGLSEDEMQRNIDRNVAEQL
jgi:hypothetical protein